MLSRYHYKLEKMMKTINRLVVTEASSSDPFSFPNAYSCQLILHMQTLPLLGL